MEQEIAEKKQNFIQRVGLGRLLSVLLCLVVTCVFVANNAVFTTQKCTTDDFVADNFSGEILQGSDLQVFFEMDRQVSKDVQLRFVPSEEAARFPVQAQLYRVEKDESETLVETWEYAVTELGDGAYLTHPLTQSLQKGERYKLVLSSQETQASRAMKVNTGVGSNTQITAWYLGEEQQAGQPEIGLSYIYYSWPWLGVCLLLLVAAWIAALVKRPGSPLKGVQRVVQPLLQAGFFLAAPLPVLYAIELLNSNTLFALSLPSVLGNYLLCLGLQLLFFAVLGNSGWAASSAGIAALLFGVANYYVTEFRSTVILPYDMYALGTAGEVAGGYTYEFSMPVLLAVVLGAALIGLGRWFNFGWHGWRCRVFGGVAAAALGLCCLVYPAQHAQKFGAEYNFYRQTEAARVHGFLLNFAINVPAMKTPEPENYQADAVAALVPSSVPAAEDTVYPNIIVVMDESFTDVSTLLELETNQEVLPYLHSLKEDPAAFVGQVAVPVYGGGTSCTEYEVLTGASLKIDRANLAPYMQYFSQETPTMVSQMKDLGYSTLSIHAAEGKNWYRNKAYPNMGFETSLFLGDLNIQKTYQKLAADSEGYSVVLQALEETQSPLFTFYLTIQNHGGYHELFDGAQIELQNPKVEWKSEAGEYLSLLHESDAQLQEFLTQLQTVEEPTVVLFFGDHWSCFSDDHMKELGLDTAEFTDEQRMAYYSTPYVMWSNCGYDFSSLPAQTSANYLFPLMLQQLGLPRTAWDEFLLQGMEEFPVFSLYSTVQGTAGSRTLEEYTNQYACLQYNLLVDTKHRADSVFG